MKYRILDENGDYSFGTGQFLTGQGAVAQAIRTRLYLLFGQWWENTEDGLPAFQEILGRYGGDEACQAIDLIISERIQGTEYVKEILTYESSFDPDTRTYLATCSISTSYGAVSLSINGSSTNVEVAY